MEDPMKDIENPNWDLIKKLMDNPPIKDKGLYKEYICKKCKEKFISPRYAGKYPLCVKHRLKD
jgi:formylmethanofuran dehydrogenase subunit E